MCHEARVSGLRTFGPWDAQPEPGGVEAVRGFRWRAARAEWAAGLYIIYRRPGATGVNDSLWQVECTCGRYWLVDIAGLDAAGRVFVALGD